MNQKRNKMIIFETPSFDLLEDVKKKFGVVFTPNTPIVEVEKTIRGYMQLNTIKTSNNLKSISR